MRITVTIDDNAMREVQRATGERKKSPAVSLAIKSYLRDFRKRRLIAKAMAGQTDYALSNEELEARSQHDPH